MIEVDAGGRYVVKMMIRITRDISIQEGEIIEDFIRASGPGGQNVNKVSSAVQLRFNAAGSPSLPNDVRRRLIRLAGRRATDDGVIVIDARRCRTQHANRRDAMDRLVELIRAAARKPTPRRKTAPTLASRRRRLETKRRHSQTKRLRGSVGDED